MKTKTMKGMEISRLTLGTVALGIDYGISNREGKPSLSQSHEIIRSALEAGINTLDTARSYGSSEEVIGGYFRENSSLAKPTICSKCKISRQGLSSKKLAFREIESSIEASLRYLNLEQLPVCLFHMDRKLPLQQVLSIIPDVLEELKKEGLIAMAGVSIDHPREVPAFLNYPVMEVFQVPVNIFDQRLLKSGMLRRLKEEDKIVFARSIFLQGLFFLGNEQLSGNLKPAASYLDQLKILAGKAGMTVPQLAFSFVRDLEGITSLLFGAEKVQQVEQNIEFMKGKKISSGIEEEIRATLGDISETIITPALWA